jgi:hypothetical protein
MIYVVFLQTPRSKRAMEVCARASSVQQQAFVDMNDRGQFKGRVCVVVCVSYDDVTRQIESVKYVPWLCAIPDVSKCASVAVHAAQAQWSSTMMWLLLVSGAAAVVTIAHARGGTPRRARRRVGEADIGECAGQGCVVQRIVLRASTSLPPGGAAQAI